eukprot:GHVS01077269.1.p1 GENE.GHVS01077269.1~~GHVS01077269.1.p1  ORF type:complete len:395 (-),score=65.13 GHVS01077269.1:324-1379(-)
MQSPTMATVPTPPPKPLEVPQPPPPAQQLDGSPPPPPPAPSVPPNETLYVNNLNDRVKAEELKKHLNSIFKQFGEIREIIAMKSFWRRGQAWVVFRDKETAIKAMQGLQGFPLYNKPMRINFARTKSDLVAREDGTFEERQKGPKKPRSIREREEKQKSVFQQMQQQFLQHMQQQMQQSTQPGAAPAAAFAASRVLPPPVTPPAPAARTNFSLNGAANLGPMDKQSLIAAAQAKAAEAVREANKRRAAEASMSGKSNVFQGSMGGQESMGRQDGPALPNRTLFVENLPEEATEALVTTLFKCYPGFVEARIIQGRRIAFIDYETHTQSTIALQGNQGRELGGNKLRITFAK